ncbi:MAG TPA: DUF998 domain-containing protein [Dehalococcoidia bacterium]|nr:DUF998 domain-containing protein [Dehalococcoidia bacterium]
MSVSAPLSTFGHLHAPNISRLGWRKVFLGCGVAALLLYFGMDLLAASRYHGYSYADQTISELSAIGAPTRSLWIPLGFLYSVLTIAGGLGVWASAAPKRPLRLVAVFVTGIGILGLVAWPFAPMHQREILAAGGGTVSDTMHLTLGMVDTLLFVLSIALGATAFGKRFRLYSIATIVLVLAFGAFTGMDASKVADNDPTPWVGIAERIAVFGSMLWIAVLSVTLLRAPTSRLQAPRGQR